MKRMTLDKIERVEVAPPEDASELVADLGNKANDKLGYRHLKDFVFGDSLARVLVDLGIPVLSARDVSRYQSEQLRVADPERLKFINLGGGAVGLGAMALMIVVALVTGAVGLSLTLNIWASWIFLFSLTGVMLSATGVGWLIYASSRTFPKLERHWQRTSLRDYTKPIPEHALAKAVAVAERLPGIGCFIEEIAEKREERRPFISPDPFLVVSYKPGGYQKTDRATEFYLDVWAEPGFKGKFQPPW